MPKLYVTEFSQLGFTNVGGGTPQVRVPHTTTQVVAIGASSAASAAFQAKTVVVRLAADSVCSFVFGTTPVATANDSRMDVGRPEYFFVDPSLKVACITNT